MLAQRGHPDTLRGESLYFSLKTGTTVDTATTASRLAETEALLESNPVEALTLTDLEKIRVAAERLGALVTICIGLGSAYADLKDYPRSIGCYKRSIGYAERDDNPKNRGNAYSEIGTVYSNMDSAGTALRYLEKWL